MMSSTVAMIAALSIGRIKLDHNLKGQLCYIARRCEIDHSEEAHMVVLWPSESIIDILV